jgi:hypothetical protein
MNYREYLKSQGYTDAEITAMETAFGGADKIAKAFETPMREKAAAEAAATAAKTEREEFENFYNNDVLPKVSGVYQDAINQRTRAAALEERLKSATEYGFLSAPDPKTGVIPGVPAGTEVRNPVPGSPAAPGAPASATLDPRYVQADAFTKAVNDIPDMLGRLTKMSNEHFSLFGSPLLDVDTLITEARAKKVNVLSIWEAKYKVPERRKEIADKAQADHDKGVADAAVTKYLSEHGMPFTAPGRPSVASHFTPQSSEEARHPWKGAVDRKRERQKTLLQEFSKSQVARVQ